MVPPPHPWPTVHLPNEDTVCSCALNYLWIRIGTLSGGVQGEAVRTHERTASGTQCVRAHAYARTYVPCACVTTLVPRRDCHWLCVTTVHSLIQPVGPTTNSTSSQTRFQTRFVDERAQTMEHTHVVGWWDWGDSVHVWLVSTLALYTRGPHLDTMINAFDLSRVARVVGRIRRPPLTGRYCVKPLHARKRNHKRLLALKHANARAWYIEVLIFDKNRMCS